MAQMGDFVGNLMTGELTALPGLGALGHLYLQYVRMREVLNSYAETRTGNLFNCGIERITVSRILVAVRILAAFTRVAHCSKTIHC